MAGTLTMMRGKALALVCLAMASGAMLSLAYYPGRDPWLAWVGVVPLLLAFRRTSPAHAALLGLAAGLVFEGLAARWLMSSGVHPLAYGLIALFLASRLALFGLGAAFVFRRRPAAAGLVLPALWVLLEYLRVHLGWLSVPWTLLGYTQHEVLPVARVAAVAGIYGVSFTVLVGNVLLAELVERLLARGRLAVGPAQVAARGLVPAAVLAVALFVAANPPGPPAAQASEAGESSLRVAVVQAGAYDRGLEDLRERDAVLERYVRLTREAAREGADLVVWPESAVPVALPYDRGATRRLLRLAQELQTPLLVGASGRDKSNPAAGRQGIANSAFLIHPDPAARAQYDKIRLVPFNEYLPARWVSWPAWIVPPKLRDTLQGERGSVIEAPAFRIGVQICWEGLFAADARRSAAEGVDFLVTLTNESFTTSQMGFDQLFAMNRFRAIENRLPLVRAATNSVSAVVGPDGRVLAQRRNGPGILVADLPRAGGPTFYTGLGDWFVALLAAMAAGAWAVRPRR